MDDSGRSVIGIFSNGQMHATSVTVPVMMVFSFLPMLSMFNDTVKRAARITYSQQISELINGIGVSSIRKESVVVIALNFIAATVLFITAYHRRGPES